MSRRWRKLTAVSVTRLGDLYTVPPAVTITPPTAPKQEAQAVATISGGIVDAINLDSGGNFYATPPTVTLSPPDAGGTQATAGAVIRSGAVDSISIIDPGSNYSTPPTVTIAKSIDNKEDFGATIAVVLDSATGTISAINVVDSGNFYDPDNPPTITIDPPYPTADFERGEDVTMTDPVSGDVIRGEVADFIESSQTLSLIHTGNDQGEFIEPTGNLDIVGQTSGSRRKVLSAVQPSVLNDASDEFNDLGQEFLDFSESNPFGEPEAATLQVQAVAAAAAAAEANDKIIIQGTEEDPDFEYPKSFKIIADNDTTFAFVADSIGNKNYVEGIRDLNVPSLKISTYDSGTITNAFQIEYTPQNDSDKITVAGDGFTLLGMAEGNYTLNTDPDGASSPVIAGLQAGDSAPIREGDSVDAGFMTDVDYAARVASAQSSMIWDSAAEDFGMGQAAVSYGRNYPIDVAGLDNPANIIFGQNGRRAFYSDNSNSDGSADIFGAKLETPFDISSISNAQAQSIDISAELAKTLISSTDSSVVRGGASISSLSFNPSGTQMWAVEQEKGILAQFDLADSWDVSTATLIKGIATAVDSADSGFVPNPSLSITTNSDINLKDVTSLEWYDSGRKMAVNRASTNGAVEEFTFSTPYDISTLDSVTAHSNINDSIGKLSQFQYKLANSVGSMFNKDGTKRYYMHTQFSDSDYDSSASGIGTGLEGNRLTLVRTDLSVPYDMSTMTYHSQVELTNATDSGAPSTVQTLGSFAMSPNGSKVYVMTSSVAALPVGTGWSGTSPYNMIEFASTPDSAGTVFTQYPNIDTTPMGAYDSALGWGQDYDRSFSGPINIIQADSNNPYYVIPRGSGSDSDGNGYLTSSAWTVTVGRGSRYDDSSNGDAFFLEGSDARYI